MAPPVSYDQSTTRQVSLVNPWPVIDPLPGSVDREVEPHDMTGL